ncbi:MAG: hypothetical protein M1826_007394 [Phylliscum demangeonii]|nr:MAG: hypothetical protein M1826_007394 [Phylliscum demangeonii]
MASALQHPQQPQGSQLQPPARLPQPQPHHLLGNASTGMAMGVGVGVFPQLSASTEEILKRMQAQCGGVPGAGGWEAAREHVLQQMAAERGAVDAHAALLQLQPETKPIVRREKEARRSRVALHRVALRLGLDAEGAGGEDEVVAGAGSEQSEKRRTKTKVMAMKAATTPPPPRL